MVPCSNGNHELMSCPPFENWKKMIEFFYLFLNFFISFLRRKVSLERFVDLPFFPRWSQKNFIIFAYSSTQVKIYNITSTIWYHLLKYIKINWSFNLTIYFLRAIMAYMNLKYLFWHVYGSHPYYLFFFIFFFEKLTIAILSICIKFDKLEINWKG